MNTQLDLYVSTERVKGVPDETIKAGLKSSGWSDADIADAMKVVVTPMTQTTPWMRYLLYTAVGISAIVAVWYFVIPHRPGSNSTTVPSFDSPVQTQVIDNHSNAQRSDSVVKKYLRCEELLTINDLESVTGLHFSGSIGGTVRGEGGVNCKFSATPDVIVMIDVGVTYPTDSVPWSNTTVERLLAGGVGSIEGIPNSTLRKMATDNAIVFIVDNSYMFSVKASRQISIDQLTRLAQLFYSRVR